MKFREKKFSKFKQALSTAKDYVKKNPTLPLSGAMLGVSGTSLYVNKKNAKDSKKRAVKQDKVMQNLNTTLSKLNRGLNDTEVIAIPKSSIELAKTYSNKSNMIKFKAKDFSIKSDAIGGAKLGMAVGSFGLGFLPKRFNAGKSEIKNTNVTDKFKIVATTTLVGAALGTLVGIAKGIENKISRNKVNQRLVDTVVMNLKKSGFQEGTDFTRNPKDADKLKTKICIVVTKNSGELKILINTISDTKLDEIAKKITKNIPNSSAVTRSASNRHNDIIVTTISDSSADANLVGGISEQFIRSGYPVYLIEVGG